MERVASSFPRSGSASVVLISNINMLADHKQHASGAFWSTERSTGADQRSEVHELRRSQRAPQWQGNDAGLDAVGKACRGTAIQLQISRAEVRGTCPDAEAGNSGTSGTWLCWLSALDTRHGDEDAIN